MTTGRAAVGIGSKIFCIYLFSSALNVGVAFADTVLTYRRTIDFTTRDSTEQLRTLDESYTVWLRPDRFRRDDGKIALIYRKDSGKLIVLDHRRRAWGELEMPTDSEKWPRRSTTGYGRSSAPVLREKGETKKVRGWTVSGLLVEGQEMKSFETEIWRTADIPADMTPVRRIERLIRPGDAPSSREEGWEQGIPDIKGVEVLRITRGIAQFMSERSTRREELLDAREQEAPAGIYEVPAEYRKEPLPEPWPSASLTGGPGIPRWPFRTPSIPPDEAAIRRFRPPTVTGAPDNNAKKAPASGNAGGCYQVIDLGSASSQGFPWSGSSGRLTDSGCALVVQSENRGEGREAEYLEHVFVWKEGRLNPIPGGRRSSRKGGITVTGINESCQVSGIESGPAGESQAFLWDGKQRTALGTPGWKKSTALALNDRGQVVGSVEASGGEEHPILWDNGVMIDLGSLGGKQGRATGINRNGEVVGWSSLPDGNRHAFLWQDGVMNDLGTLEGDAILNDAGQVAWRSSLGGFLWEAGRKKPLPSIPSDADKERRPHDPFARTNPLKINAAGQVLGDSDYPIGSTVLWSGGPPVALSPFGGKSPWVRALNDDGVVAGTAEFLDTDDRSQDGPLLNPHKFLWQNGEVVDLDVESCLSPPWSWSAISLFEINNKGWMSGIGRTPAGAEGHTLLLIPPDGKPYPGMPSWNRDPGETPAPTGQESLVSRSALKSVLRLLAAGYVDETFAGMDWGKALQESLAHVGEHPADPYRGVEEWVDGLHDPTTRFYRPGESRIASDELFPRVAFPGFRLRQDRSSRKLFVAGVVLRARAFPRGVVPGDEVLEIGGISTKGMGLAEAERRLGGSPGESVSLRLRRGGTEKALSVERLPADGPTVLSKRIPASPGTIGYLRVSAFDQDTEREIRSAVLQLEKEAVAGFLLDLRGNPGGDFDAAVAFARAWIDNGTIVSAAVRGGARTTIRASEEAVTSRPLVVLVDETTSGSAEIVAAALQESGRGKIVGTRSAGTAALVRTVPLKNFPGEHPAISFRAGRVFSPSGRDLFNAGVSPDVVVELSDPEREKLWIDASGMGGAEDRVAVRAIEFIEGGKR